MPILYMLGKGGISVLQTSIFNNKRKLTLRDTDKKAKNEGISVRRCKLETC